MKTLRRSLNLARIIYFYKKSGIINSKMATELPTSAVAAVERTRRLLYDKGGMRELLELVLQQGGVQNGTLLEFESKEDSHQVSVFGVLRDRTVKGISVVKVTQLPDADVVSKSNVTIVPTEDAFEPFMSEFLDTRKIYYAAGQSYLIPLSQMEKDFSAIQRYEDYRTAFSDLRNVVDYSKCGIQ